MSSSPSPPADSYQPHINMSAVTPKWSSPGGASSEKLTFEDVDKAYKPQPAALELEAAAADNLYKLPKDTDLVVSVTDAELQRYDIELAALAAQAATAKPTFFSSTWLKVHPQTFTWILVIFASMGGLLSGLDQSLISGANLYMPAALNLTTNQVSLVNSFMPLGAVGGALILGPCNETLGRKMSIIVACILYTIGAILEAVAQEFGMMAAGRLILGVGLGLEGGTVPVYVAECVPATARGNLVSLYQFAIALGEVFGYIVAAIFVNVDGTWRWMLGSSLVFSTILLFGMFCLPESPRFLEHKDKKLDAYIVWSKIRGFDTLESKQEFFNMRQVVEKERQEEQALGGAKYAFIDFYRVPRARRAIIYANVMIFLGQFTGVNAIMYYMSILMKQNGFDDRTAVFMSLVGGGSLLLGTIPAILYMDRFGRRVAAIGLLPIFFIGLVLVGVSSVTPITDLGLTQGLYLSGVVLYMGGFGSYACLTWVIPSESYPNYLRSYGMVTSDATLFLCAFIMTYCFQMMEESMTLIGVALGFFGGIAVLGEIYQILFMPETKNKTLEEIDALFEMPTSELVAMNWKSSKQTVRDMFAGRWKKAVGWTD